MALSFSFLNKKKEQPGAFSNPQNTYQSVSNQAGSLMFPSSQSQQQSKAPQQTSSSQSSKPGTYQGKILGSGLTSNYAANPSNTGPQSPGYKPPQAPAPQVPKPQVPQMQANNYLSVLQNYLNNSAASADQRAQLAASSPDRIAQQQQRLLDWSKQQAQQQAETAQQRFDIFKQNRLADVADLEKGAELSRSNIATNRDAAVRSAAENNRSSMNQLQELFAGLGTLDSGAFQRLTANQQAKFAGGQQGIYKQAEQDLNDIEVNLNSARREAQGLIQYEELNLQDKLAQIDATIQKGTIEYQNAVENAVYEAENKIATIYDELGQIENDAELRYVEYMDKINSAGSETANLSPEFLQTGIPQTREDYIYRLQNPDNVKELSGGGKSETTAQVVNLIDNLLSRKTDQITGFGQYNPFNMAPGSDAQLTKNYYNRLKALLSLENRQMLKGSGAISDYEARVLEQAASELGQNLSDEQFRMTLENMKQQLGYGGQSPSNMSSPQDPRSFIIQ